LRFLRCGDALVDPSSQFLGHVDAELRVRELAPPVAAAADLRETFTENRLYALIGRPQGAR
jgi:hypothetical protein